MHVYIYIYKHIYIVSATSSSLVQKSPTDCGVSLCVI